MGTTPLLVGQSSPAVAHGLVVVGSDNGKLYVYPAACSTPCYPLWKTDVGGSVPSSSAAIADGVIYVGSADGKLHAFGLT